MGEVLAPGLKTIDGATEIRLVFLVRSKRRAEPDPAKRAVWLTFVIVVLGPPVSNGCALSEIAYHAIKHDFRHINPNDAQIILIEGGHKPLHVYNGRLVRVCSSKSLKDLKVDLRTDTTVTDICEGYVSTQCAGVSSRIETNTVIWAAGVAASPLARQLAEKCGATTGRAGQIAVGTDLTVPNHPEIMVIATVRRSKAPMVDRCQV